MSLPSQTARPIARRSHMYRRRRRNRKILLAGGLTAAIIGGGWLLWPDADDSASPAMRTDTLQTRLDTRDESRAQSTAQRPAVEEPRQDTSQMSDAAGRTQRQPQAPKASATGTLVMGEPIDSDALRSAGVKQKPVIDPAEHEPEETFGDPEAQLTMNRRSRATANDAGVASGSTSQRLVQQGKALLQRRPVDARLLLSQALRTGELTPIEMQDVRRELTELNHTLVFSPQIVAGDPYSIEYTVQSGDLLQKIVNRMSLQVNWRFISRINNVDPRRIRVGQRMKLITGPFHAVVDKSAFRLDLYLGDGPEQVFVCSMPVGLGQYNSTPEGLFRVRPKSKAVNPAWVNPRTGEAFDANDPENPIGEHWIGLEGVDPALKDVIGYGIHGTTEPDSIGEEASMGCVRLGDDDVKLLYEVLVEEASLVRIVP